MRSFEKVENEERENSDTVISLARKAVTYFKNKRFNNLNIEIKVYFGDDPTFYLTVFNKESDNVFFDFYSFTSKAENKLKYSEALEAIKKDDFEKVREAARLFL